jgi:DNA (cytosine-5)-methyltransferase 3A
MNVLSLFDGISCGQIALNRSGIFYSKYYSSEIDKYAIQVTQHNYPCTVQLGNIIDIKGIYLPKIDLLMGGSPCQGFSFAGKQLNFADPRSKLIFEFIRLLNEVKPKYFLLENVKMKKQYEKIISDYMGVNPIEINSSLLSKQNRVRLYWTNIDIQPIIPKNIYFNDYLYRLGHGYIKDEIKYFQKYPSLAAQSPATKYRIITDLTGALENLSTGNLSKLRRGNDFTRSATAEECEDFQTLPIGYTKILKKGERFKCIGNGWTVDIISHIFKGLQN